MKTERAIAASGRVAAALAITFALSAATAQTPQGDAQADRPRAYKINEHHIPEIKSGPWTGPRTPDGQPDISGYWSNMIANHNNFEDPQGGSPGPGGAPAAAATAKPRDQRAPSRVLDPPDGLIPYQPWARAAQQDFAAHFTNPRDGADIEPLARCAPGGVPKSFYWHGYEIRQYPNYILFIFGSGSRIIHLDDKPHLPENIKLWNADSRGRWEGNTLVVDVTNNNSKALFGRYGNFASENVHITERYIFSNDGKRYNYVATFTDPTVYTRPWTALIPAHRYTVEDYKRGLRSGWDFDVIEDVHDGDEVIISWPERTCVENNGGFAETVVQ
jgi:hypothetical protein